MVDPNTTTGAGTTLQQEVARTRAAIASSLNPPIRHVVIATLPDGEGHKGAWFDYVGDYDTGTRYAGMVYDAVIGVFDSAADAASAAQDAEGHGLVIRARVESFSANALFIPAGGGE
jgi:hypothetical protein